MVRQNRHRHQEKQSGMEQNLISQRRPHAGLLLLLSSGAHTSWLGRGLLVLHRRKHGNTLQSPCLGSHTVFENPVPCETRYHEEPFVFKSCCPFFTPRHRWTQASPPGICEQLMDKWILSPFLAPLVAWNRSRLSSLCCRCSGTGVGSAQAGGGRRDRRRAART